MINTRGGASLLEDSATSVAAVLLPVRDTKLLYWPLSLVAHEQGSNLNFSQTLKSYLLIEQLTLNISVLVYTLG